MSEMNDPYDDQLRAARYRAERDQAREELARIDGGAQAAHRTYGALSDEDRKILWWVHARGGLQEVRRRLKKSVPHEAYERKRGAWRRHIRACEEALRKRNARIRELENAACERRTVRVEDREASEWVREHGGIGVLRRMFQDADNRRVELCGALGVDLDKGWSEAMAAMHKRLMPEGCEWPRFEDGELVRIGDEVKSLVSDDSVSVDYVEFRSATYCLCQIGGKNIMQSFGGRFKRPAPKVLDADGAEIRVGETPYRVDNGRQVEIRRIDPSYGESCVFVGVDGMSYGYWLRPDQLTHERPDSWERLEEDARGISHDISWNLGNWSPSDFKESGDNVLARIESLIPRAKALAERGQ